MVQPRQRRGPLRVSLGVASLVLLFAGGWLTRAAARPRTTRLALGAGAVVGLIATLVAFAFLGPMFATLAKSLPVANVHPVETYEEIFQRGASESSLGFTFVPPRDATYLEPFLSDADRIADDRTRKRALEDLQRRALEANKIFAALVMGWIVLAFVGTFLATWALHGAWAADYLARSARHPVSRALTYVELVVLTLAWTLFALVVVGVTIVVNSPNVQGGPMWASRLLPTIFGATIVAVAHAGVVRLWHPAIRMVVYLLLSGLGAGLMWLAGCF